MPSEYYNIYLNNNFDTVGNREYSKSVSAEGKAESGDAIDIIMKISAFNYLL